jgi:hypothetical protein
MDRTLLLYDAVKQNAYIEKSEASGAYTLVFDFMYDLHDAANGVASLDLRYFPMSLIHHNIPQVLDHLVGKYSFIYSASLIMFDTFSTEIKNRQLRIEVELSEFTQTALKYLSEALDCRNKKGHISFSRLMTLLKDTTEYDNVYIGMLDVLRSFDQVFYNICRGINYFADTFMDPNYWYNLSKRTIKVNLKSLGVLI